MLLKRKKLPSHNKSNKSNTISSSFKRHDLSKSNIGSFIKDDYSYSQSLSQIISKDENSSAPIIDQEIVASPSPVRSQLISSQQLNEPEIKAAYMKFLRETVDISKLEEQLDEIDQSYESSKLDTSVSTEKNFEGKLCEKYIEDIHLGLNCSDARKLGNEMSDNTHETKKSNVSITNSSFPNANIKEVSGKDNRGVNAKGKSTKKIFPKKEHTFEQKTADINKKSGREDRASTVILKNKKYSELKQNVKKKIHKEPKKVKKQSKDSNKDNRPKPSKRLQKKTFSDDVHESSPSYEHLYNEQVLRDVGLYVLCDRCDKTRYLLDVKDPLDLPDKWYCEMNPAKNYNKCTDPNIIIPNEIEEKIIQNKYNAGSIVWAKMDGYPWWPAMVDDDPNIEDYFWLEENSNVPTWYHVTFFDEHVSRAWIRTSALAAFKANSNNPYYKTYSEKYRRRLEIALQQANDACKLELLERLRKYSFIVRYMKPNMSKFRITKNASFCESKHIAKRGNYVQKQASKVLSSEIPSSQDSTENMTRNKNQTKRQLNRIYSDSSLLNSPIKNLQHMIVQQNSEIDLSTETLEKLSQEDMFVANALEFFENL